MNQANIKTSSLAFISVLAIGTIALAGWLVNKLTLAGMGEQIIPMAPSTILCFLITGFSGYALIRSKAKLTLIKSLLYLVVLLCILIGIDILSGYRIDIEGLFLKENEMIVNHPIGRMSIVTNIMFVISAVSMLVIIADNKLSKWAIWITTFALFISLIFCIGYLYGTPLLYSKEITPPAWNTSLSFALLFFGILSGFGTSVKPLNLFVGQTVRARLMRGFLPVTLLIIFLLGWANTFLDSLFIDHVLITTIITIVSLITLTGIILKQSESIGKEIDHYLLFRKEAQDKLKEQETHFHTLANSGQALIWTCGTDKKCNYFNQPWLDYTGRSLEQELGDGWTEGVHPEDLGYCFETFVTAFDQQDHFSMDYRLRYFDGTYRWIQDNGTPRYNSQGKFIGYIGHCLDITDRKLSEQKLINSEFRFRELLEKINLIAVILDTNGNIVFCNRHLLKLTGYTIDELYGKNWFDMILPAENDAIKKIFISGLKTGAIEERFENPILTKSGIQLDVKWSNVIQRSANNEITGIAAVGEDITEQKKAQMLLQNKDRLISLTGKMGKVGGWEFDVKTGKGTWTEEVAKIHALDPNAKTNKSIGLSFYEGDFRALIENGIANAITNQLPYDLTLRMTDAIGTKKWVRTIGIPIVEGGITTKLQGTFQDISDLKKTEEDLQKLNLELEQRVANRTLELEQKNADLERMNKLFVGRELRMVELKNQINDLSNHIQKTPNNQ